MNKYGFEHLRFSRHTYRQRNVLMLIGCIAILFFEYHITEELKIYNVGIPNKLIVISLNLAAIWITIQFIFSSLDDYIDWKKNFLIDKSIRPQSNLGDRTILLEFHSFSKGEIKYNTKFGHSYGGSIPETPEFKEIQDGLKSDMRQLEDTLKDEIKSIESFRGWYKRFSWLTIFRFVVLEFALPLIFILYAVVICRIIPILPQ